MKRYLVFSGETYYPSGGWGDFVDSFDTEAEARAAIAVLVTNDWSHIIDATTGQYVYPVSEVVEGVEHGSR